MKQLDSTIFNFVSNCKFIPDLRTGGCDFGSAQHIAFTIDCPDCHTAVVLIFVVYLNADVFEFN